MFVWSIIHAKFLSNKNDLIIVTSDSKKISTDSRKMGATPFLRSPELSGDKVFTELCDAGCVKRNRSSC